jgi:hypothetical protein
MDITRLRSALATLLSAALVVSAPGLAPYEAMAQVVGRVAPVSAPVVPGAAGVAPVAPGLSAPSLTLSLPAGLSPSLVLPAPVTVFKNGATPTAAAASAVTAEALTLPSPARGRGITAAEVRTPATALPTAHSLPLPLAGEGGVRAAAPGAFSVLETAGRELAPRRSAAAPIVDAASSALFDGAAERRALSNAVSDPVGAKAPSPKRRGVGLVLKKAVAAGVLITGLRMAVPQVPALPAEGSFWRRALDAAGRGGYIIGNVLAFAFAVPQIYKTFKDGGATKTPVWRAAVGASASLSLGLISAPLAKQMFWGVQNVFGGLALAAPILIGAYLARRGLKFSARKAAALTAATTALLFAPSFAMYAAAAEAVPGAIASTLGAVAVGHVALGLQIATGLAFFLLFVPDIVAIVKGRAPKGFTSMFSMLFALASAGFIAWTLQMAAAAPAGSSERVQFLIYAAQNAAYALVSLVSWYYARREERKNRAAATPSETR